MAAIDDAVKRLEKMGLGEEDQVKAAKESKKRIKRQNEVATALEGAVGARDKAALAPLCEEAEALNMEKRFGPLVAAAKALLELLVAEGQILKAIKAAMAATDEEALEEQRRRAEAVGAGAEVKKALKNAARALTERAALLAKLREALAG